MTMIVTNIHEVKARLSEYLEAVARGERVVICKRNTPIAELRAIAPTRTAQRRVGGAAGRLTIPDTFFQPLPEDVLDAFDGSRSVPDAVRVAERQPAVSGQGKRSRTRTAVAPRAKSRMRP